MAKQSQHQGAPTLSQVPAEVLPVNMEGGHKKDKGKKEGANPCSIRPANSLVKAGALNLELGIHQNGRIFSQVMQSLESMESPPGPSGSQSQSKQVSNIVTWVRCFSLYLAVMAQKRESLVAPMVSHPHAVIKLHQSVAWDVVAVIRLESVEGDEGRSIARLEQMRSMIATIMFPSQSQVPVLVA